MNNPSFFDALCQKIRNAYVEIGHSLNWSFLYTSETTLSVTQNLFFVGLNPGGGVTSGPYEEGPSSEAGNAYLCEDWGFGKGKSPLQQQIQALYDRIASHLNVSTEYKRLMNQSLSANYVPFRSPNWRALPHKKKSLHFADSLWRDVLDFVTPAAIISMAEIPYLHFVNLLQSKGFNIRENTNDRIGWGKVTYSMKRLEFKTKSIVVIRLPHLSTYKIFSRRKCESAINKFTLEIAKCMNEKIF